MNGYLTYLLIASLMIASPGPGVVFSICNSLRYGFRGTAPGVAGVATGNFLVALASATSIGAALGSSPTAYAVAKLVGALYLIYLGIKMLFSKSIELRNDSEKNQTHGHTSFTRFKEGMTLTLSNPKAVLFFVALFPQFIDSTRSYIPQFLLLSLTFCILICLIHSIYAVFFAYSVKLRLMSSGGFTVINRIGGVCFLGFAVMIFYTTISEFSL